MLSYFRFSSKLEIFELFLSEECEIQDLFNCCRINPLRILTLRFPGSKTCVSTFLNKVLCWLVVELLLVERIFEDVVAGLDAEIEVVAVTLDEMLFDSRSELLFGYLIVSSIFANIQILKYLENLFFAKFNLRCIEVSNKLIFVDSATLVFVHLNPSFF